MFSALSSHPGGEPVISSPSVLSSSLISSGTVILSSKVLGAFVCAVLVACATNQLDFTKSTRKNVSYIESLSGTHIGKTLQI